MSKCLYWSNQLGLQKAPTASRQRSKTFPTSVLNYEIKQCDGEASIIPELWRMQRTILLPSLSGQLWPKVVESHRFLSLAQIGLNCVLMINGIL